MPVVSCPACGAKVRAPEGMVGRTGKCPACHTPFRIPSNSEVSIVRSNFDAPVAAQELAVSASAPAVPVHNPERPLSTKPGVPARTPVTQVSSIAAPTRAAPANQGQAAPVGISSRPPGPAPRYRSPSSPTEPIVVPVSPPVATRAPAAQSETKACPYCGEQILNVAKKCKHCGEMLDETLRTERDRRLDLPLDAALNLPVPVRPAVISLPQTQDAIQPPQLYYDQQPPDFQQQQPYYHHQQQPHYQQPQQGVVVQNVIHNTVVHRGPKKSAALAFLLAFLFGPLGMLYSTVPGALVLFLVNVILVIPTLGLILLITWPIGCIWAAVAASSQ